MSQLGAVCDEFYVSSRLFLKLEMGLERETVLHFLDRLRREYPGLRRLRRRDGNCLVLEEDADANGSRRWIRLDPTSLRFGHFSPSNTDDVFEFGRLILEQAPYHLSFSEIDYDYLEVVYGFDLAFRGNHDQLVAEVLLGDHAGTSFLFADRASHVIDAQPCFGIALTPSCDRQAYVEVKSRTTTYEIRNESFENESISVLMTARQYWGVDQSAALHDSLQVLFETADELASDTVVPGFVNPLAAAIASRS